MPRIRFRDFSRGLWLMGGREDAPDGTMRRSRGISVLRTLSARSRDGSLRLYPIPAAHSLFKFGGVRFQGAANVLYRNGVPIDTGQNGQRLAFVTMPPQPTLVDQLFVTGGGRPLKVDSAGAVTRWGILPPEDIHSASTVGVLGAQQEKDIEMFSGDAGSFVFAPGSDAQVGLDAITDGGVIAIGGASVKISVGPDVPTATGPRGKSQAYYHVFSPLDLTTFIGGFSSPLEDFITLWVHLEHPSRVEQISITFTSGDQTFGGITGGTPAANSGTFVRHLHVEDSVKKKQLSQVKGLGDLAPVTNQDATWLARIKSKPEMIDALEQIGTTEVVATRHTWTRLRLPKGTFHAEGQGTGPVWSDIRGIMLGIRTNLNGRANVYFSQCQLRGGYGLLGDYQYLFTRRNNNTGSRSNPNATPLVVKGVERQSIHVVNIPQLDVTGGSDPQVTHIEAWRTLGNGSIFFLDQQIPIGTTFFEDKVADYPGLDSTGATTLGQEALPRDNAPPLSAPFTAGAGGFLGSGAKDAVGPHVGRMWWCRDDGAGATNVYFSPSGRPESVSGFLTLDTTDDQTQKLVRWNDTLYLFSTFFVFEIVGTTEPFLLRRILGVPGTTRPFTVKACPDGVYYEAADGIRRFDGVAAPLVAYEAIGLLYDNHPAENLQGFQGIIAAHARDEYIISDGTVTLGYHLPTGTWRDVGAALSALYFEEDMQPGHLIVGAPAAVLDFELPGQIQDDSTPLTIEWQTPSRATLAGQIAVVQRIYVECYTNNSILTPTILLDGQEIVFPPFSVPGTTFQVIDMAVARSGRILGVRLDGTVAGAIEVTGVEADIYVPGGQA